MEYFIFSTVSHRRVFHFCYRALWLACSNRRESLSIPLTPLSPNTKCDLLDICLEYSDVDVTEPLRSQSCRCLLPILAIL